MKHFPLYILMLPLFVFCSCREEKTDEAKTYEDYTRVSIKSEITHVQPMTGIVLWTDSGSKTKKYVQLEFSYMLYNDVCKGKDVYDWSVVDNLLDAVASRGHQAVLRFRYTYVGKSCSVPDYIKALPDYEALTAKAEGRNTEYPDWRCQELQRFHLEFHRRFAERYDKDPRLAFLETGFGHWAEYHVYDGKFIAGRTFPSKDFQSTFLGSMANWFKNTPWMISIDAADPGYSPFESSPGLLENGFGNFDDSFMCEDHDGYNTVCWEFFGTERYKSSPFGGEFSYYSDYDQKHALDKAGMYGRVFEDEVAKFHMTFIIGNDQPGKQSVDRIEEAAMSMGYRFVVKDFRIKEGTGAAVMISNAGVAPIYRDAYVAVDGKKGSYNLRNLMPGETVWVETDHPAVSTASKITIECNHLVKGQEIQFDANII